MAMNTLKINGTALANIYVDASLAFNKPDKNVETIPVPGRNGSLIIDNGTFNNVTISYPCYIRENFAANWDNLISTLGSLSGYQRIECSNDTAHFRRGRVIMPQTPNVVNLNKRGFFELAFDCMPQRFLISGETARTFTATGTISNPTKFTARPLIRIYGTGTLTVNGTAITLSANSGYTDVDSTMQDCYNGSSSRNQYVTLTSNTFPVLKPGSNNVTFGAGITQAIITPNFWEL